MRTHPTDIKINYLRPRFGPPRIAIIDNDPSVRRSIGILLGNQKWRCEEFERASDFQESTKPSDFNCLIVDVKILVKGGIELFDELVADAKKQHTYLPPVVFITGHGDIPMAVKLMHQGAIDFLEKPVDPGTLLNAISTAVESDCLARDRFIAQFDLTEEINRLTLREREVLSEIVGGYLSKQIAEHLNISTKTVEAHRLRICQKFNTRTSMELAAKLRDMPVSLWEADAGTPGNVIKH